MAVEISIIFTRKASEPQGTQNSGFALRGWRPAWKPICFQGPAAHAQPFMYKSLIEGTVPETVEGYQGG